MQKPRIADMAACYHCLDGKPHVYQNSGLFSASADCGDASLVMLPSTPLQAETMASAEALSVTFSADWQYCWTRDLSSAPCS